MLGIRLWICLGKLLPLAGEVLLTVLEFRRGRGLGKKPQVEFPQAHRTETRFLHQGPGQGIGQRLTPELRDWIAPIFERAGEAAAGGAPPTRWSSEQIPQLVLAIYHVVIGYYAIAPFYKQLNGQDLLAEQARARQTALLVELVETLFSPDSTLAR